MCTNMCIYIYIYLYMYIFCCEHNIHGHIFIYIYYIVHIFIYIHKYTHIYIYIARFHSIRLENKHIVLESLESIYGLWSCWYHRHRVVRFFPADVLGRRGSQAILTSSIYCGFMRGKPAIEMGQLMWFHCSFWRMKKTRTGRQSRFGVKKMI